MRKTAFIVLIAISISTQTCFIDEYYDSTTDSCKSTKNNIKKNIKNILK